MKEKGEYDFNKAEQGAVVSSLPQSNPRRIIYFVCDSGDQMSRCRHFFRLHQRGLSFPELYMSRVEFPVRLRQLCIVRFEGIICIR